MKLSQLHQQRKLSLFTLQFLWKNLDLIEEI